MTVNTIPSYCIGFPSELKFKDIWRIQKKVTGTSIPSKLHILNRNVDDFEDFVTQKSFNMMLTNYAHDSTFYSEVNKSPLRTDHFF